MYQRMDLIVDGQPTDKGEFAFRNDGRIIGTMDYDYDADGNITVVITTAPPISHLPHTR